MDQYVTGTAIRELRQQKGMTQLRLAQLLSVSDKTVSKWETGKGYPDITLLEPIAGTFGISVMELLSGNAIRNMNISSNVLRSGFYVCPVCGNVIQVTGEADVRVEHEMTKQHYISFIAALSQDRVQMVKLYPEGNAEARFKMDGVKRVLCYCNRDGLFQIDLQKRY